MSMLRRTGRIGVSALVCVAMMGCASIDQLIAHCESVRDYVSRELFEDLLEDTEGHIDQLETQIGLVAQVGEQNWLQSQMGEPS